MTVATAEARPTALSKEFETDKKLGVGLALGIPSGVLGKFLVSPAIGLDFGVGAYVAYRDRTGIHAHADLLWQPFVAVEGISFLAPMYVGFGGRFLFHDSQSHLGARIPAGISFDFTDEPYELFVETAFVFDVVNGQEGSSPIDVNGLVGVRYYLK